MTDRLLALAAVLLGALIALLSVALLGEGGGAAPRRAPRPEEASATPLPASPEENARAPDPRSEAAATDLPAEPAAAPAAAAPADAVLFGRVTGSKGEPLDGYLSLFAGESTEPLAAINLRRDDSEYAVPGLAPGPYRLRARAMGYRDLEEELEIPDRAGSVRRDVRLSRSWQLRVLIATPDGTPLLDHLPDQVKSDPRLMWSLRPYAVATAGPPPDPLPSTDLRTSDFGFGRWFSAEDARMGDGASLPQRFAGYLELPEDRPLTISAVMRTAVLASAEVEAGQSEVTLTVPVDRAMGSLCTVRLQVVDGVTKEPVAGARASLSDAQSGSIGQPVDDDGRIELRHQRPGLLNVDIGVRGRQAPSWNVELMPGDVVDLGAIPVFDPVEVKGRLEGLLPGERKPSLTATSLDRPPHPALRPRVLRCSVAEDGSFGLRLAPGRYLLRASRRGGAELEIDTRALRDEPLVIALQPEAVLRVTPPPLGRRIQLTVLDSRGRALWDRWITWTSVFEIPVPPGAYTVVITGADGSSERRALQLPAGRTELDLR